MRVYHGGSVATKLDRHLSERTDGEASDFVELNHANSGLFRLVKEGRFMLID
jgi:hypothetical protein